MQEPENPQNMAPSWSSFGRALFLFCFVGVPILVLIAAITGNQKNESQSRAAPAGTNAETAVDVEPTPELAMPIVYGDSHWRWIVPLLIFFLVIDGTVIAMYLASISKKLDRLPQAPSP